MRVLSAYKEWAKEPAELFEPGMTKGDYTIIEITYHEPQGEGDAHYIDVRMDDDAVRRIFRPDEVLWAPEGGLKE